jgi:nondiscriminating aspartyl-tRNA synthetase
MERTLIKDLSSKIGQVVEVQGWMQTLRDQKQIQFMILRDRTGLVQVTLWKPDDPHMAGQISHLNTETALTIVGRVAANEIVKLNQLEIQLQSFQIDGEAESPLPLDPTSENLPQIDYRLDWRYLDLRRTQNLLLFQIQTTVTMAMREYWLKNGFIEIFTPKIMGTPSESGAELFTIEYFERKAYLAQSPQFYKQMAMASGFERVFEIGPAFRADPSFTSRHMTEFVSVDMEMSWIDSDEDVMQFQENWLAYIYSRVIEQHGEEISEVYGFDLGMPSLPFPRIPVNDANEICEKLGYALPPENKGGMDPQSERIIGQYVKEKYHHDFVFLTEWPMTARPFYHMREEKRPGLTRSYDLIAGGLEIATGAQREHRPQYLVSQALEKGLNIEPIQFYIDFFRYGCPPHGGFGFGLARLMMIMLNLTNIREAVYLFRGPTRLSP